MVVVVVVVDAMAEKGTKIGTVQKTLGRAPSKDHNVSQRITLGSLDSIKKGEEYIFEISGHAKTDIEPFEIMLTVHNSNKGISIPLEEIEKHGLKPGHALVIKAYEIENQTPEKQDVQKRPQTQLTEDGSEGKWEYISTVTVIACSESSDGCDSRVIDSTLHEELNGRTTAKIHNTTKNEMATSNIKPVSGNDVSLKQDVRRALDASPGDKLNVYLPSGRNTQTKETQLIREVHNMISDIHAAYLEQKE